MTLIVGFDSAWTAGKQGGIVAVAAAGEKYQIVCEPTNACFATALDLVSGWKRDHQQILLMLDQPTVVSNEQGGRGVEKIVSSLVSRARGGMQPANRQRKGMFCDDAPVWGFLRSVGGSLDPRSDADIRVVETYPVLAMLGLGWLHPNGHLFKYNPERRKTFRDADWQALCGLLGTWYRERQIPSLANWCCEAAVSGLQGSRVSRKACQDKLDALICLLVGLHWFEGAPTIQVGSVSEGLIVAPMGDPCRKSLEERIAKLGWLSGEWLLDLAYQRRATGSGGGVGLH
jgi:predicted RNase H-like nuclease